MASILEQRKWESLKKRRRDGRLIMPYKDLKGAFTIHTNNLVPTIRHVTLWRFQPLLTFTRAVSFPSPLEIGMNSLTDSRLSNAEGADDSIAKFTSFVRARD